MVANSNAPAKGAIRNPEKLLKAALRRRTERFDSCFPRGISLGDIDSFVEVNNHFLFLEWKLGNQDIPTGQRIAFSRLASLPKVSLWVLWTDENGEITHGIRMGSGQPKRSVNEQQVADAIRQWVAVAETKPSNENK